MWIDGSKCTKIANSWKLVACKRISHGTGKRPEAYGELVCCKLILGCEQMTKPVLACPEV